ncbi:MAG: hypothetical protein ABR985_13630 [Methanotrichaceae archaeon]
MYKTADARWSSSIEPSGSNQSKNLDSFNHIILASSYPSTTIGQPPGAKRFLALFQYGSITVKGQVLQDKCRHNGVISPRAEIIAPVANGQIRDFVSSNSKGKSRAYLFQARSTSYRNNQPGISWLGPYPGRLWKHTPF